MSKKCKWTYDDTYDVWETTCKQAFCIDEGTPKDNGMKYCCYCGKPLKEM